MWMVDSAIQILRDNILDQLERSRGTSAAVWRRRPEGQKRLGAGGGPTAKKRLLRQAVAPLLPKEIVRGKKQGFSAPIAAWLRGELQPLLRDSLSVDVLSRQGFLDPPVVACMIDEHTTGREDLSRQLWGLLSFTLWYERFAVPQPAAVG